MIAERIIESLRICATDSGCKKCAYRGRHAYCFRLQSDAADLIEQQAAEIIQLKNSNAALWQANEALRNEKANGGACDVHPGQ